jgi:hypothetical protein
MNGISQWNEEIKMGFDFLGAKFGFFGVCEFQTEQSQVIGGCTEYSSFIGCQSLKRETCFMQPADILKVSSTWI